MKKFALFLLLLSVGMFSYGCDKPKPKEPAKPAAPATPPSDMPPAEKGGDDATAPSDKPAGDTDAPAKDTEEPAK